MNQVANYSHTDITLWYVTDKKVLCKAGKMTSIPQNTTDAGKMIHTTHPKYGDLSVAVAFNQNIYVFDSDIDGDLTSSKAISSNFAPDVTAYGMTPCIMSDGKFVKVSYSGSVPAEKILNWYGYKGTVDTTTTYDLSKHKFGDGLSSNMWLIILIILIIVGVIAAAAGLGIYIYRDKVRKMFSS